MIKKKIGIDINEVLRARWQKFDELYCVEFGEEGIPEIPYVYDFFDTYKWLDTSETMKYLKEPDDDPDAVINNINPQFYQLDENGNSLADSFLYEPSEELKLSAKEIYNRFMYQEYVFEIFGCAPKMYKQLDLHFKNFCINYNDDFEIIVVSKENFFSIPPTLHFLSIIGSRATKYIFVENSQEIWNNVDILVTADPELIKNKPDNKKIIKVSRIFNKELNSDLEIMGINDLNLIDEVIDVNASNNEYNAFMEYKKYNKYNEFLRLIK